MKPSDLKKWRSAQGLTQKELAGILGVAGNTIYRWESGMREIPSFLALTLECVEKKGGEDSKRRGIRRKEVTVSGRKDTTSGKR